MHLNEKQMVALMSPLSRARVSNRSQGGRQLSYLEAWDVKAALIRMFGFGGFSAECIDTTILKIEDNVPNRSGQGTQFRVTALCTVRLTIHPETRDEHDFALYGMGAVYTESAVSSQSNPDPGEAADFAVKTAESDALKRAATYLGTQFGLGLYDNGKLDDVVRVMVEPTQAALLDSWQQEREAQHAEGAATAQQLVNRATGAQTEEAPPEASDPVGEVAQGGEAQ